VQLREWIAPDALRLAWLVSLVATAGSLYMSLAKHFQPCELCWYQRIAMYPLVVILGVAILRSERASRWYALPLCAVGATISAYHYQLERFPDQDSISCSTTVPCTTIWFEHFGYITLPMMALSAFVLIAVVLMTGAPPHGQVVTKQA
jgi:disulfide bond formation protein DsbB